MSYIPCSQRCLYAPAPNGDTAPPGPFTPVSQPAGSVLHCARGKSSRNISIRGRYPTSMRTCGLWRLGGGAGADAVRATLAKSYRSGWPEDQALIEYILESSSRRSRLLQARVERSVRRLNCSRPLASGTSIKDRLRSGSRRTAIPVHMYSTFSNTGNAAVLEWCTYRLYICTPNPLRLDFSFKSHADRARSRGLIRTAVHSGLNVACQGCSRPAISRRGSALY